MYREEVSKDTERTFNDALVLKNIISCLVTLLFALSYLHFSHITAFLTMKGAFCFFLPFLSL